MSYKNYNFISAEALIGKIMSDSNDNDILYDISSWKGYFVTVVTPFNKKNYAIDWRGFEELLLWHIKNRVHGFVIAGTTGEWTSLTVDERLKLFQSARDIIPSSLPLIAGCSALTINETIQYIHRATDLNYDGILLTLPPYINLSDDESVEYYKNIAENSKLPIIIYNWPLGVGTDLNYEVLTKLVNIENIVAIKNSTTNFQSFLQTLENLSNSIKIFGIMPSQLGIGILEHIGGVGCIGAANVLGSDQPEFFEAVWKKDFIRAKQLGQKDHILMQELFNGFTGRYAHAVATFKYALQKIGLPAGVPRPPILPVHTNAEKYIDAVLAKVVQL